VLGIWTSLEDFAVLGIWTSLEDFAVLGISTSLGPPALNVSPALARRCFGHAHECQVGVHRMAIPLGGQ
jgi:hypothetical protein